MDRHNAILCCLSGQDIRRWLGKLATHSRRIRIVARTFIAVYGAFLLASVASRWYPLNHLVAFLGIALCPLIIASSLMMVGWIWRTRHLCVELEAVGTNSGPANAGAVAVATRFPFPRAVRRLATSMVDQSITSLTAPTLLDMSVLDRNALYEFAVGSTPETCRAVLRLCEQAGDIVAIPYVRRIVRRYRNKKGEDISALAYHCLEILMAQSAQNQNATLLRPSESCQGTELLRSGHHTEETPAELLRSSQASKPDPPHQRPE